MSRVACLLVSGSLFCGAVYAAVPRGTWKAFGHGLVYFRAAHDGRRAELRVDWTEATWGVGCTAVIESDVDMMQDHLRFRAFTAAGSETHMYVEVETTDGTRLVYPKKHAKKLTGKPTEFRFSFSEMIRKASPPRRSAVDRNAAHDRHIKQVKVLFLKHGNTDVVFDSIFITRPKIFSDSSPGPDNFRSSRVSREPRDSLNSPSLKSEDIRSFNQRRRVVGQFEVSPVLEEELPVEPIGTAVTDPALDQREASKLSGTSTVSSNSQTAMSIYGDLVLDYSNNLEGGSGTGSSRRGFLALGMVFDLRSAFDWDDGTIKVELQRYEGDDASLLVGDYQGTGNNDTDDVTLLAELWIEKSFLSDLLRLKIGKIDANTEFAFVEGGSEFMNTSLSFASPTISAMTTTPETAFGANLFLYPFEEFYGGVGVYDGATLMGGSTGKGGVNSVLRNRGELFIIGELGMSWTNDAGPVRNRLGLGIWRHTGTFDRLDSGREESIEGVYLIVDRPIWQRRAGPNGRPQSVVSFLQYGYSSGAVSEVVQHLGMGLLISNIVGFSVDDTVGIGLTWVEFTDRLAGDFDDGFELVYETFYKYRFQEVFSLKADLQYVVNPSGDSALENAFVPGLRLEALF